MTAAPAIAPAETDATSRGLPRALVIGWLAVFVGFLWLQGRTNSFTSFATLSQTSVIELIEIAVLVRLFTFADRQTRLSAGEALATLAGMAAVVLVAGRLPLTDPWIAGTSLIAFYGLCRFGRAPAERAFVLALFLFFAQYAFGWGPFIWLHDLVGQFDAAAIRRLLAAAGYAVAGSGSIIISESRHFAVDVNYGCSSSYVIARVVPAFLIVVLGMRRALRLRDLAYLAALAAATIYLNLLRLMPVALSRPGYEFWHDGFGASLLAALFAVLILAAAYAATRGDRRAMPS